MWILWLAAVCLPLLAVALFTATLTQVYQASQFEDRHTTARSQWRAIQHPAWKGRR